MDKRPNGHELDGLKGSTKTYHINRWFFVAALQWGPRLKEIECGPKLSSFAMEATYGGPGLEGVSMQNVENFDENSKSRKINRQFFLYTIVAEPCATGAAPDA